MLGTYHLSVLYDTLKDLHFLYETDRIYGYLLENIMKALDADAASLFVADPAKGSLSLRACIGPKKSTLEMIAEELPFPYGKGVCGWVAQFHQPVMIDNVQTDPRFNPQVDTLTGYKTKSILCAPIANKDEVLGVIEVLNKKSAVFNKNDLDLVTFLGRQTAIALANARLYADIERTRKFTDCVFANLTSGFASVDEAGVLRRLNPTGEALLGILSSDCVGKPAGQALNDSPPLSQALSAALSTRQARVREEADCQSPAGRKFRLGFSVFPILDGDLALGAGIIFQDLSAAAGGGTAP